MPELPEVEVARRNLLRWLKGRRVVAARARPTRVLRGSTPRQFSRLSGKLLEAERRGKYLLLTFEGGRGLLAHLGMTGKFVRRQALHGEPYSKAYLALDDGEVIHYRDPRLFGRLTPMPAAELHAEPAVAALGRDPFTDGLTGAQLAEALGLSRQPLKVALMDQARVAGLGNIHVAEALYRARLHPGRLASTLDRGELTRLARAIHAALAFGLARTQAEEVHYVEEGHGAENPFLVYGHGGKRCRRCGGTIASFAQGGRTTYYCPGCQPAPAPAGRRGRPGSARRPRASSD